nr:hypothetical protein CFP56_01389 [Quercus suber]
MSSCQLRTRIKMSHFWHRTLVCEKERKRRAHETRLVSPSGREAAYYYHRRWIFAIQDPSPWAQAISDVTSFHPQVMRQLIKYSDYTGKDLLRSCQYMIRFCAGDFKGMTSRRTGEMLSLCFVDNIPPQDLWDRTHSRDLTLLCRIDVGVCPRRGLKSDHHICERALGWFPCMY